MNARHQTNIKIAASVILIEAIVILAYAMTTVIYLIEPNFFLNQFRLENQNFVVVTLISTFVLTGYLAYLMFTRLLHETMSPLQILETVIADGADLSSLPRDAAGREHLAAQLKHLADLIERGK